MKDGCTSVAFGRRRRSLAGSHRSGVLAAVFALVMAATLLSPSPANAQEGAEPQAVQVGMFVASIHDLDFYEGTFQAIFWLWFIYDDANYRPLEAVEVVNARDYEIMESYSRDRSDGRYYMAAKFSAEINQHWDTTNFPFDDQRLEIVVESVGGNASELVFRADRDDSVNGGEVVAKGWAIQPLEMETSTFRYNTNFGEETASELAFSRITFAIPLHRDNPKLFFEAYIGYMISFVMCAAIWMTLASNMPDYRIGMVLAATFTAIGNKTVLETNYPPPPSLALEDKIEIATFLLIAISMLIAVGTERLHLTGRQQLAHRISHYGMPVALLVYVAAIAIFVYQAV